VNAATQTWSGTNSGVWDVSALNWDAGADAWTSGNDALFSGTPTNNVTAAIGLTIGAITLDNTFTGSVTITGSNTVSGATTISGGTLNLTNATGLGTSAITVNSGGTLAINPGLGNNTVTNTISGAGLITAQDPAGAGGNTLQLGGNYTNFSGTLNILAGASNFGKVNFSNTSQANVMSSSATIQVRNGATLYLNKALNYGASVQLYGTGNAELSNNGSSLGALRLEAGANQTGTVTLFANSSIGVNASAATISGVIGESGGSFGFTKGGNNSLTLSGANTFSGTTTHAASSGTLRLANSLALQNSTLSYTGAAALVFDSTVATHAFTFGGLTGSSNIALTDNGSNSVALTVGNNNTSPAAYSGVLSGGGSLTKVGSGTLTLSSANTYTGATTVNAGTLLVSGSGNVNGSSGITINGSTAKYVKTSTSAGTVPITLTQGTLDGTGTVGAVTVGNGTGGIVTNGNGNGGTTALTMSSLTFNGASTIDLNKANDTSTVALAVTGAFTTTAANGQITLNVLTAPAWANGSTYDLISYGSFNGANTDFTLGTVTGLGGRQTATIGNTGAGSGFITLSITGNTPVWTGAANGNWTTTAQPTPFNWVLEPAGTTTQFLTNDQVLFDDTATGTTAINIADASVSPASVIFNNSSKNYSVSSGGGFGIASGSVSKSGTGSLTLSTANTYNGGTTLNAGTLNLNNASAIGTGSLTIAAGTTIDNTSGSAITLSTNNAQIWNGDFTFGGSNDLNLGTGAVTLASSLHLTTSGTATLTVGGVIGGPSGAGLFKEGTGTLVLNGANTFNGGVTIDSGTLRAGNALALGPSTNSVTFGTSSNGKLQVNGNAITVGTLNGDSTATIENSNATNGSLTVGSGSFAGVIQNGSAGTLALAMSGTGTLALTGANTYSGGTTLGTGTLSMSGNSPLGTGTVVTGGGTISTSAAATLSNAITLNGATTFTATGGTMVLSGNITGSPTFWTLNPTNKITLSGTNSVTTSGGFNTGAGSLDITGSTTIDGGANVNAGYATIGNGANTTATLLSGGSLTINGTTNGTKPNTIVGQNVSNSTLNVGATDKSSSGTLTIGGNTGFVLGNNNASSTGTLSIYSGTATITAGSATLQNIQNYIAMGRDNATGIINLNGGTLATGRQFVRDGSGGGTVGAGTATFNFNGGTLQAQADQTQGNGWFETATTGNFQAVTTNVLEGGAIIDTNGFTVNIQSILAHGGSNAIDGGLTKIGAGTLSLGSGSDPSFTGDTFTGNVVVNAGTLSLASNITLNSAIVLSLASNTTLDLGFLSGSQTVQELFLNGTAVAPGTYSASDLNTLGSGSNITFTSFGGTVTVTAVPEPATMALISIGLVCVLFGFRRNGRKLRA
jgi:autotransporter-associated beta strand protein